MKVYMVWLFDWFWEQSIPIGVFMTEDEAARAAEIVVSRKREEDPDNVPEDRYDINIEETQLNGYSSNCVRCVFEA